MRRTKYAMRVSLLRGTGLLISSQGFFSSASVLNEYSSYPFLMRKFHLHLRFRINLAAHDHADTTVLIHLIDPLEPVDTLVFRNDHPGEFPWSWEFRTHMRMAAVGVEVFVRKHTNGGRPMVWVEAECKEYH